MEIVGHRGRQELAPFHGLPGWAIADTLSRPLLINGLLVFQKGRVLECH